MADVKKTYHKNSARIDALWEIRDGEKVNLGRMYEDYLPKEHKPVSKKLKRQFLELPYSTYDISRE